MTDWNDKSSASRTARSVPKVGLRRLEKRSHNVPSSMCALRPRSRRVQPCRMRARSISATSTAHGAGDVTRGLAPTVPIAMECNDWPCKKQWKARCYAFRAFHPAGKRRSRPGATDGTLVFGGPLLGDPDRHLRTAAGSPTGAAERQAIASPTIRPSAHFGNVPTRSRCASRARVRARAVGRGSPIARPAFAARLRRPWAAPA